MEVEMKRFLIGIFGVAILLAGSTFLNADQENRETSGFSITHQFFSPVKPWGIGLFKTTWLKRPIEGEMVNTYGDVLYFGVDVLKPQGSEFGKGYTFYLLRTRILNKETSWYQFYWGAGLGVGFRHNKAENDTDDWLMWLLPVGVKIGFQPASDRHDTLVLKIQTGMKARTNGILSFDLRDFWHLEIGVEYNFAN